VREGTNTETLADYAVPGGGLQSLLETEFRIVDRADKF
jgi:hypothetical protein